MVFGRRVLVSGVRIPTEVLEARGLKHLGKAEIEERKKREPKPSKPVKKLAAPEWLPEDLRPEFNRIARAIVDLMPSLVARTDGDTIASYCVVFDAWKNVSNKAAAALAESDLEAAEGWSKLQDRYFKEAMACANALGLTISSRCRLVMPEPKEKENENPFLKLREARRA